MNFLNPVHQRLSAIDESKGKSKFGVNILLKKVSPWLPIIRIILFNDIQLYPGPRFENIFYNFMSIFNYELISICETSCTELKGYLPAKHPDNVIYGGVGLFSKHSLPIVPRNDLSCDGSIELKFGRNKIYFLPCYIEALLLNMVLLC